MPEYTLTTDDDASQKWAKLNADQQAHELIANRSTKDGIRESAAEKAEELARQRDELEARIVAAARIITVKRVDPKVWGRVVSENPPRPDDPYDARMGVNTDTFDRAIMPHAITSVTDGLENPVEWDWGELVEDMSPGKYEEIIGDVLRLHMEREAVPFSLADYRGRLYSEQS